MDQTRIIPNLTGIINILEDNSPSIDVNFSNVWTNFGWSMPYESTNRYTNTFEIYYVLNGELSILINEKSTFYKEGDLFFIDNSIPNTCGNGKFTLFGFNYSLKGFDDINKLQYFRLKEAYKKVSCECFHLNIDSFRKYFLQISNEFVKKAYGYCLNAKLLMLQTLLNAVRSYSQPIEANNQFRYSKYSSLVSDIILYMSENMYRDISLAELGVRFCFSPRYLNRFFKGVTGYPVIQYLNRLKIEKAKQLLRTSSLSLLDIACELGFASGQYFVILFKKITGYTPGKYRKNKDIL